MRWWGLGRCSPLRSPHFRWWRQGRTTSGKERILEGPGTLWVPLQTSRLAGTASVMSFLEGEQNTMPESKQREIANLLDKTQTAHGAYEERVLNGVYDQDWPAWYAVYLVAHGIADLFGQTITAEQLARLLKQYDEGYRAQQRQDGWPDYYAAQLLA